ncbi:hypothetical protein IJG29_03530, partial [Candidatus Saccharibacteria bacterium]|nr:hypothetical protein [Candidatus Saccharibacteria bacterium]
MKRISLFLISTLTFLANFGGLLAKPAAAVVDHTPVKGYWTVEEMEEFAAEIAPALDAACPSGSYPGCKNQYLFKKGETDKIYRALQYYQSNRTLIKAFNPGNNTIRVNVRAVSAMNAEYGIFDPEDVVDLYIIRTDKNYVTGNIPKSVKEGDPKVYVVYNGQQSENGDTAGWFPMDTDVTLRAEDLTIDNDYYTSFIVHAHMGTYGDVTYWHYDEINPSEYIEGMEYRLVFTATSHKYILTEALDAPIFNEPTTVDPEQTIDPEPTVDPEPIINPEPVINSESANANTNTNTN